jgi:hypothetical protein
MIEGDMNAVLKFLPTLLDWSWCDSQGFLLLESLTEISDRYFQLLICKSAASIGLLMLLHNTGCMNVPVS